MNILLARHYGMCFGVRDALRSTHTAAQAGPITVLGQLVHNPLVDRHLKAVGALQGQLHDLTSAATHRVAITAHGASQAHRQAWTNAGHSVLDTTCPLVRKAHDALALLVAEGYHPVVIGQRQHAEVLGLVGDYSCASVILDEGDATSIPCRPKLGIIAQTTQPLEFALELVAAVKRRHPRSEVRFIDTICHPTKQRQTALDELLVHCDHIVVIGGRNSNNTRQLALKAEAQGRPTIQVEQARDLEPQWFSEAKNVGVTAGTSTLDETVQAVIDRLQLIAAELSCPAVA